MKWSFGRCRSPASGAQLEVIGRYAESSTLDECFLHLRGPRVHMTFDDGSTDNRSVSVPISEATGIPITDFETNATVGNFSWLPRAAYGLMLTS